MPVMAFDEQFVPDFVAARRLNNYWGYNTHSFFSPHPGYCINEIFYHLDPHNRSYYRDYTGCGNTVNCNHPLVTQFIVHCLEYWVKEMHVDGFRFDLASGLYPWRRRRAPSQSGFALAHRIFECASRGAHDCGGMGCFRPLSCGIVSRLALGGVERPLSRRRRTLAGDTDKNLGHGGIKIAFKSPGCCLRISIAIVPCPAITSGSS